MYEEISKDIEELKKINPIKAERYKQELLLIESKRRYPVGTKFNSTGGFKDCVISMKTTFHLSLDSRYITVTHVKDGRTGEVYNKGRWAEIIEPVKECELDKWLRETKAMNLNKKELAKRISSDYTCPYDTIYCHLDGIGSESKADILYNQWYGTEGEVIKENLEPIFRDNYSFKISTDLISLKENGGVIDPSVRKTKSIKTELVSKNQTILF